MPWTAAQRLRYKQPYKLRPRTEVQTAYAAAYYQRNKAKAIRASWCRQIQALGCTEDQYSDLLTQQQGLCAICNRAPKNGRKLAVDHDHLTGQLRGLLCLTCNTALGSFQDSPDLLEAAKRYLCRGIG